MKKLIEHFELIYKDPLYDRLNNPELRDVKQLSPIGFRWNFDGKNYENYFSEYGSACLLSSRENIGVVDIEKNDNSSAYILSKNGNKIFELPEKLNNSEEKFHYFDVYLSKDYGGGDVCFFSNVGMDQFISLLNEDKMKLVEIKYIRY